MSRTTLPLAVSLLMSAALFAAEPLPTGDTGHVPLTGPTRLDWVFCLANQSVAEPPAEWLAGYDPTQITYELHVPKAAAEDAPRPLVLFISPTDKGMGWSNWQAVCEKHGAIFASPRMAGNNCPTPRRVRIVLDVLDDIRRRTPIDPDRTYITGFSGGGRIACAIGFSLPELFGGVVPICAAGDLRSESWLRQRVVDRLSVGHVTGEADFNRGEVERFRGPMLEQVGVRSRTWMVRGLGHGVPKRDVLSEVFDWLDADLPRRKKLAEMHPASRIATDAAPSREVWAKSLLAEGRSRLTEPATIYTGLMQLKGIRERWPDLDEAEQATKILADYDARRERPWDADDIAEQRRFLIARARCLDAYATGPLPQIYEKQQDAMLQAAINLWQAVIADGQDERAVTEARRRIPKLEEALRKLGRTS